jgi:hypothetical protein
MEVQNIFMISLFAPSQQIQSNSAWKTGIRHPAGAGIFLFATASKPALGLTQPPIQRVPGALFPEVRRPRRETGHSSSTSAEGKKAWSYNSGPAYVLMVW